MISAKAEGEIRGKAQISGTLSRISTGNTDQKMYMDAYIREKTWPSIHSLPPLMHHQDAISPMPGSRERHYKGRNLTKNDL